MGTAVESRGWGTSSQHWDRRPVLAVGLRVLVFVLPVLLAFGATVLLGRVLPRPAEWWGAVLWWLTMLSGTLAVLVVADRILRRMLPLAALFELSLVFPDRAPARFRMWRRGGSVAQLRAEMETLSRRDGEQGPEAALHVLTLVAALAVHDPRTRGHSERVRILTDMLAEEMSLTERDRDMLRWAALLHDIGKLEVPGPVLRKPAALDATEWETLRRHPQEGDRLLGAVRPWLGEWATAVAHHHEHYDGNGYPQGLRGEDISLGGRIVGLADAFEAMTGRRAYSKAVTPGAAREELVRRSGTQFDPAVCRAFLNFSVGRLWRVVGLTALATQVPLAALLTRLPSLAAGGGTVVVAGAAAVAVGLVPVVGVTHGGATTPSSAVAGAHTPAATVPIPFPAIAAPGVSVSAIPPAAAAPGAPAAAPAVALAPRHSTHTATSTSTGTTTVLAPVAGGSVAIVSLTVRLGSVHKGVAYVVAGLLSGCSGCTVTVDWGDGSGVQSVPVSGSSFVVEHTYTTKGRYVFTVTASGSGTSQRVVVNNDNGTIPAHT